MNEQIGCEAVRREKHIELHDAIQQIGAISQQLDDLIHRIEGPSPTNPEGVKEKKEALPTLRDILDGGAGVIMEKTEDAHKRISRLNELLF